MRPLAVVLLAVGLARIAGDLLGVPAVEAAATATMLAPGAGMPVTAVTGHPVLDAGRRVRLVVGEGPDLIVDQEPDGAGSRSIDVTPERWSRVAGPGSRRRVHATALVLAPGLEADAPGRALVEAVLRGAFCGRAPLLRELGIGPEVVSGPVAVRVESLPGAAGDEPARWHEVDCP